ncbi:MAG: hydroxymethylbilane synthase [Myxococcota bacterium]
MNRLRLATRGSQLAVAQSQQVADAVTLATGLPVELVIIQTRGDRVQDRPLAEVGGKGLFTLELEQALLEGRVEFAVHSMKDMPTDQPDGLGFAAVPKRVDPRDALVGARLADLAPGAVVGTGSLRRGRQLKQRRPDLQIRGIRGNVDSRIRKQQEGQYDAIVLAAAGLQRLSLSDVVDEYLSPEQMLPAVGQGALALQVRLDRSQVLQALAAVHHAASAAEISAERAFLRAISGGCSVPAACFAQVTETTIRVRGLFAPDEGPARTSDVQGPVEDAVALGEAVAAAVLD